uniref:Uncharacterized protein n=1 Tax=Ornithorhynchus anatinus TaxID=9258 RepID=F6TC93_ORNAN
PKRLERTMARSFQEEVICPICLDYFFSPVSVPCGHIFCHPCIAKWARTSLEEVFPCPECRSNSQMISLRANRRLEKLSEIIRQYSPHLERSLRMMDGLQRFRVDMTLDVDTANPYLILSEDRRSVRCGTVPWNVPNNPERFYDTPCVLGVPSLTSGVHYWEVEVAGRTQWDLGVCRDSVNRKGKIELSPAAGYWVLSLRDGTQYWACGAHRINLHMVRPPLRVGVFVDVEAGDVTFYNLTDGTYVYTFANGSFRGPLRPFFCSGIEREIEPPLLRRDPDAPPTPRSSGSGSDPGGVRASLSKRR